MQQVEEAAGSAYCACHAPARAWDWPVRAARGDSPLHRETPPPLHDRPYARQRAGDPLLCGRRLQADWRGSRGRPRPRWHLAGRTSDGPARGRTDRIVTTRNRPRALRRMSRPRRHRPGRQGQLPLVLTRVAIRPGRGLRGSGPDVRRAHWRTRHEWPASSCTAPCSKPLGVD